jgi:hypothetical protein
MPLHEMTDPGQAAKPSREIAPYALHDLAALIGLGDGSANAVGKLIPPRTIGNIETNEDFVFDDEHGFGHGMEKMFLAKPTPLSMARSVRRAIIRLSKTPRFRYFAERRRS